MKNLDLERLSLTKLDQKEIREIEGGKADAKAILGLGLAIAGVVALFVAPPTAFFIVPASTAAGIGLGSALDDVFGG